MKHRLVFTKNETTREFVLQEGITRIGRGDEVEVSLDESGLSRVHAQVELRQGVVTVSDLGSKNGTIVEGKRISGPVVIAANAELVVGEAKLRLLVSVSGDASETAAAVSRGSRTQTGTVTGLGTGGATSMPGRLIIVSSTDEAAVGRTFSLGGATFELGRGDIEDPRMSRRHIRVTRMKDRDYLEDLGSANGTFLDGESIGEAVHLEIGQVIRIGSTFLVVDSPLPNADLPARADVDTSGTENIIGISLAAEQMRRAIATVGPATGTVLLLGETGVGKEVAATAIHGTSGLSGSLVPVNCASISSDSMGNDELFGHYKGAFSGADRDREGCFVRANKGTLFLDEVGELPAATQAKLLRVLQDGVVQPLGDGPASSSDARVVAATNAGLGADEFRGDLLARLEQWTLRLPPLRERRADILVLWDHFVSKIAAGPIPKRAASFDEALLLYKWPRNIRELKALADRAIQLLPKGGSFTIDLLDENIRASVPQHEEERGTAGRGGPSKERLERALRATGGNVKQTAERNGWHRTQVMRWIKQYEIDLEKFRS